MKAATPEVLEHNPTGPDIDSRILRYLGSLAGRDSERWCSPTLANVAWAAHTSAFVAQQRLRHFEQVGRIAAAPRRLDGELVLGWIVPRQRDWQQRVRPERNRGASASK